MDDAGEAQAPSDRSARGSVGAEIFEQVERLTAAEGISRKAAFERLAEETGRHAGTISANYYRVARKRGVPLRRRQGGASASASPSRRTRRPAGDVEAALGGLREALDGLAAAVRSREAELTRLRELEARVCAALGGRSSR